MEERNPYLNLKFSHSNHHIFHEYESSHHHSPTYNVYEPPIYGTQSFNQRSFVAVPAKKTNLLVALIIGGVLLFLGIASGVAWYFISSSNCIPCGKSDGCVSPSHWCDGIPQCRYGEDEECFLLANSTFVLYAKSVDYGWRPVCHDHWNNDHGQQVCNRIGYLSNSYSYYGSTSASTVEFSEFLLLNESLSTKNTYQKLSISQNCSSGLLVTLHCIDCGVRKHNRNISGRIIGGQMAVPNEVPWQVSLHLDNRHICGGTILTPYWVITAAHCGERHSFSSRWKVYGGILHQSETRIVAPRSVQKFITHEKFNKANKDYDIALLRLKTPFTFSDSIRPVCLPNYGQTFPSGSNCVISGWGDLLEGGTPAATLHWTVVPLLTYYDCKKLYYDTITSRMFCAGLEEGGRDACQGDSGGPLIAKQKSLLWLVGITSWGYGCARVGKPGVYVRVTTFLDWIYLQLKKYR
ncbi:transmembrane protease serine 2-like isoform X2 [Chiloscyllium plagiosum]|uniref:transmembrane protease serine 2-like isoform X2 n=1 Tax=Chiloscyllium plagiosum TaxID=36176 RepID=UPI001CB869BA|nr:transmembrane protease serine 2-like isoform X2 [Chiloscyllium plagiosum]